MVVWLLFCGDSGGLFCSACFVFIVDLLFMFSCLFVVLVCWLLVVCGCLLPVIYLFVVLRFLCGSLLLRMVLVSSARW